MTADEWTPAPERHFVWCFYCDRARNVTVTGDVVESNQQHGPDGRVLLVRCDTCGMALLLNQDKSPWVDRWDEPERIWPGRVRPVSKDVPDRLRAEHDEARKCLEAKAYRATVVMVRRTIEGVCAESGVHERNLQKALQKMLANGLLDQRLLDWATALRLLGNAGAHYTGDDVSREDALDAISFAEAMLDYLYVLTAKFQEFQARRGLLPAPATAESDDEGPGTAQPSDGARSGD